MSLRDLYQEIIVDHSKTPRNFGKLSNANLSHLGHNPLCGDKLQIYIHASQDIVEDIGFEGSGCAISIASASLMTETVKGQSIAGVQQLFERFHELVTTGKADDDLGKLVVLSGVSAFPIRVKCATLAWHTLKAALNHDDNPVTTEGT